MSSVWESSYGEQVDFPWWFNATQPASFTGLVCFCSGSVTSHSDPTHESLAEWQISGGGGFRFEL